MRTCGRNFPTYLFSFLADYIYSDGPTPEAKTQQILAITPILSGQKATQAQSALTSPQPQHLTQSQAQTSTNGPPSAPPTQTPNPPLPPTPPHYHDTTQPASHDDLIDFGDGGSRLAAPTQAPARQPSPGQLGGMAAPPGLQEPLMPGQPLTRVDTMTHDVDEFVDAKP